MICIEEKLDLRYAIDWKHKIVDFFIEDDYGVEHRCGLSFKAVEVLINKLLRELKSDFIMVSEKELVERLQSLEPMTPEHILIQELLGEFKLGELKK